MTATRTRLEDIPRPAAYLLALVFSFLTTGALLVFHHLQSINKTTIALIYLLPVGFSATLWGLLPGIAAAFASFLSFNYFFIQPLHTLTVHDTEDLIILFAFLVVATVISELVGRIKGNLASATAREREAVQLYELSKTLSGSTDEHMIAQALADKIGETLRPERVEVVFESDSLPNGTISPERRPADTKPAPPLVIAVKEIISIPTHSTKPLIIPVQTARSLLGEIRLWRIHPPFAAADERLVRTFASQSVLAVERVRAAEAARKARVLEESDKLKSSLLSSVSHELRSPLAAVKAAVSSLRAGEVDWDSAARIELMTTIEEEIDRLNTLVGNLLDMSRIEVGALKPQKKPNMLPEIVAAVLNRMSQQTRNHHVVLDVPEDLPLISVDFVLMEQVFINLISNSLKFSPEGSTIRLAARQEDERALHVIVANQGPHVPDEHLERIFDKFYRITAADRVTGTGLGLSICKGIIEAHGPPNPHPRY
jgi:two-component system sensor histidine kinase KdpD